MNWNKNLCLVRVSIGLWLLTAPLLADDGGRDSIKEARKVAQAPASKSVKGATPLPPLDKQAEAEVLDFVSEHHAELADLLKQLKDNRPREYQKAMRDLSRVRTRLVNMQKNNEKRFEMELAVWKAETRVQLIAARLHMGDKAELREELRTALNEQMDLRLQLLKYERELVQDRLTKIESQLQRFEQERSEVVERQLQTLTKAAEAKSKAANKSTKAPARPQVEKRAKP
jgi:hypothetical protein